ncbi:MAG TPA: hypothetical protein DG753_00915 [Clostridium sp.]|nr:hypothetical protein [Clostridium sp.]
MKNLKEMIDIFPIKIGQLLEKRLVNEHIYEIRIKAESPILVYSKYGENIIKYYPTKEELKNMMQKISNYSLYAYEEDIRCLLYTFDAAEEDVYRVLCSHRSHVVYN